LESAIVNAEAMITEAKEELEAAEKISFKKGIKAAEIKLTRNKNIKTNSERDLDKEGNVSTHESTSFREICGILSGSQCLTSLLDILSLALRIRMRPI
jgi:hypothetical protein